METALEHLVAQRVPDWLELFFGKFFKHR